MKDIVFNLILFLIRLNRKIRKHDRSYLILPPAAPGSLGDQAVITALVQGLSEKGAEKICSITYGSSEEWIFLPEIEEEISVGDYWETGSLRELLLFAKKVSSFDCFYVLGTDVLDGKYNLRHSLFRLKLLEIASKVGVEAKVTGFSFNESPPQACVEALSSLPQKVLLKSRDPISRERLKRLAVRDVLLTADIAFLLDAEEQAPQVKEVVSWIEKENEDGRIVVGLNLNHHLTYLDEKYSEQAVVEKYIESFVAICKEKALSIVGIPHDYRTDVNDITMLEKFEQGLPVELRKHFKLVPSPRTPGEIKGICRHLDIVFSGKMHLAIAALGVGTPVGCMVYQGKFEGLFEHFHLPDCLITPYSALLQDEMKPFVIQLIENRGELKNIITEKLPNVRRLAEKNL